MATISDPLRLTPGFYPEVAAADYHANPAAQPSLSSSIAATIISETPRKGFLAHPRLNPNFKVEDDDKFDLGSAVHDMLASGGKRVRTVPFRDFRSEAAKAARIASKATGALALTEPQGEQVQAITDSVVKHLLGRGIDLGVQEATFIAQDRGVWVRAMMDSYNPPWISDFKLTGINLASDWTVANHIIDLNYDLKAAFYVRVASLVYPKWAGRLKFRWIFIEKEPPHGIRIVEADATMLEYGRRKAESALGIWQACLANNFWPHLEGLPATVPYPGHQENRWLERENADGFVMGPIETLKRIDDRKL